MSSEATVPLAQAAAPPSLWVEGPPDDTLPPSDPVQDAAGVVLLLESRLPVMQAPPADVAVFTQETLRASAPTVPLDQLAFELSELAEVAHMGSREGCTFDVDVPGFGRLEGRVSVRCGQADLELHALRPASAAVLRGRLHELQRMVDRESGGDVNLIIV